jgi:hypothetical protein
VSVVAYLKKIPPLDPMWLGSNIILRFLFVLFAAVTASA